MREAPRLNESRIAGRVPAPSSLSFSVVVLRPARKLASMSATSASKSPGLVGVVGHEDRLAAEGLARVLPVEHLLNQRSAPRRGSAPGAVRSRGRAGCRPRSPRREWGRRRSTGSEVFVHSAGSGEAHDESSGSAAGRSSSPRGAARSAARDGTRSGRRRSGSRGSPPLKPGRVRRRRRSPRARRSWRRAPGPLAAREAAARRPRTTAGR